MPACIKMQPQRRLLRVRQCDPSEFSLELHRDIPAVPTHLMFAVCGCTKARPSLLECHHWPIRRPNSWLIDAMPLCLSHTATRSEHGSGPTPTRHSQCLNWHAVLIMDKQTAKVQMPKKYLFQKYYAIRRRCNPWLPCEYYGRHYSPKFASRPVNLRPNQTLPGVVEHH